MAESSRGNNLESTADVQSSGVRPGFGEPYPKVGKFSNRQAIERSQNAEIGGGPSDKTVLGTSPDLAWENPRLGPGSQDRDAERQELTVEFLITEHKTKEDQK
jgi:hypothetical protein